MKKIFFLPLLVLPFLFSGCSSDDDEGDNLSLSETRVSLNRNSTKSITANQKVGWSSESEFVAKVNANGTITGNHVGKTSIVAASGSGTAKCAVEVLAKYNTYIEPVLEFGASRSSVKSKESRTLTADVSLGMAYKGEKSYVNSVEYVFTDGKLSVAAVYINYSKLEELTEFLLERYQSVTESDGTFLFMNNDIDKANMIVGLSVEAYYLRVAYVPYTEEKKSFGFNGDLLKKELDLIFTVK